jgi:drug/metabolite transporter (DMT)-like permease
VAGHVDSAIVYGLLSAFAYGAADFLSQDAGRKVGAWRASFYYYVLGVAGLSLWISMQQRGWQSLPGVPVSAWLMAAGSGILLLAAVVTFTQGLIVGQIAVVVPIMASYGAVTTVLSLAAGEHMTARTGAGIALTICGACGAGMPVLRGTSPLRQSGAAWATAAALAYGVGFWLQAAVVPVMGPLLPVWAVYASGILVMAILHAVRVIDLRPPRDLSLVVPSLAAAVLGTLAFVALMLGVAAGQPAVVIVISSLASAVTVILGRLVSKASMAWHQWLAMALVLIGLSVMRQ